MRITENIEILHWDTEWVELPQRIQSLFSAQEESFYKRLKSERSKWINGCKNRHVKKFLMNLKKNDNYRVCIRSQDGERPFVFWFTSFVVERDGIAVRLPVKCELPGKPPKAVVDLYKYIGGVDERAQYASGWLPPESIRSMIETGARVKSKRAGDCFELFKFGNGDVAGYISGGGGFVYTHEDQLIRQFDIEDFIAQYFGKFFKRHEE